MEERWHPGKLLSVSSAYWKGCTLQAAVRLEIFTHLHDKALASREVAKLAGTDERATGLLLDALTALGLVDKHEDAYRNVKESNLFLSKQSDSYMGYIILHHHHILDGWAQLDEAVRTGNIEQKRSYGAEIERESFLMGMFNLAMNTAPEVAKQIDLSGKKKLLDLGGGPGTFAIHFCLANPELQAVIFDRPTTQPFAEKTSMKFGVEDRISFVGGDFNCDPITGGQYDVAWLSHILHSNSEEQCQSIISNTAAVLEPGGLIMIHDFILNNKKDGPEFPSLFSLNMLIANNNGRSYSEEEISRMLSNAGMSEITHHPFRAKNDSSIILGLKQ